jgi:D-3-phosphoglycerate dehydrogenase
MIHAIKSGKVAKYFTDFPSSELMGLDNVIQCPHLGASTPEAEDNCAKMAAKQLDDYLTYGNITNSVNFPAISAPMTTKHRLTIVHKNIANMINSATQPLSKAGINIVNMMSVSKGDIAYMIMDIDEDVPADILDTLKDTDGLIRIRLI